MTYQKRGGEARAASLSESARKEIARKASQARWEKEAFTPVYCGSLYSLLGIPASVYVLRNDGYKAYIPESDFFGLFVSDRETVSRAAGVAGCAGLVDTYSLNIQPTLEAIPADSLVTVARAILVNPDSLAIPEVTVTAANLITKALHGYDTNEAILSLSGFSTSALKMKRAFNREIKSSLGRWASMFTQDFWPNFYRLFPEETNKALQFIARYVAATLSGPAMSTKEARGYSEDELVKFIVSQFQLAGEKRACNHVGRVIAALILSTSKVNFEASLARVRK